MTIDPLPPDLQRTHGCGELRPAHANSRAVVMGWVARRRDFGSLNFIDLRDRTGLLQVVFNAEAFPKVHLKAQELRSEYVVAVEGEIVHRDPETFNPALATGEVEMVANQLYILNDSRTPPFPIEDNVPTSEEVRLRYRYLDLRRPRMQANLRLRHRVTLEIRQFLSAQGFLEMETPFLTRSTPEGARDYLVPSRVQPGNFYALPQSPQLFKQLLMMGGLEKYFQIVRCFRDEDLRADRQPEFTQVDIEMSFVHPENVMELTETLMERAFGAAGVRIERPFPRLTYEEAIRQYGTDKPDLRLPPLHSAGQLFSAEDRQSLGINPEAPLVAFRVPGCGNLSRKERDGLREFAEERGVKLFDDLGRLESKLPAPVKALREQAGAAPEDLLLLVAGPAGSESGSPSDSNPAPRGNPPFQPLELAVYSAAGALRLHAGQKHAQNHGMLRPEDYRFLWVTDFPMFEYDEQEKRFTSTHHPFTSPHEESLGKLESDPSAVKAKSYDLVLNGQEIGGGSIRTHRPDVQRRVFRVLGFSEQQAHARFGFFLNALEYGTPPHGGIALGLDRIIMLLAKENSIREVIPFPKTARAIDLMCEAPSPVSPAQLDELGLEQKKDLS
ncbi:MAG: aspartate--tRNA ligase [Acidobacteria bacterium]|nr:aspartate--tRNA ligase [Acidobacteriota bacterium]